MRRHAEPARGQQYRQRIAAAAAAAAPKPFSSHTARAVFYLRLLYLRKWCVEERNSSRRLLVVVRAGAIKQVSQENSDETGKTGCSCLSVDETKNREDPLMIHTRILVN